MSSLRSSRGRSKKAPKRAPTKAVPAKRSSVISSRAYAIDIQKMSTLPVPNAALRAAVRTTLAAEQVVAAQISLAFVDHPTMHALNRLHLDHDESTDVLSFLFDAAEPPRAIAKTKRASMLRGFGKRIDGEIVVCSEMARDSASTYGWTPREELLLYVVHGLLHLCGYDDLSARERRVMRQRETEMLALLGIDRAPVQRQRQRRAAP